MRSLTQTASGDLLHGLVTPLYNISFTTTPSLLWHLRWNVFLRFRLTANPLTPSRRQSRISGQSRLCLLPILTGTFYLSTLPRYIPLALT